MADSLIVRPPGCPKSTKEIATEAMRHAMGLEIGAPHKDCCVIWTAPGAPCAERCPWYSIVGMAYGFKVIYPRAFLISIGTT